MTRLSAARICLFLARQQIVGQGLLIQDHTRRCNIVGRTPLDKWPARGRDLYLTTHNTHKKPTSMPPVGSELNLSRQAAAGPRIRPRGHWDWRSTHLLLINSVNTKLVFAVNGWRNVWRNAFDKYVYHIFYSPVSYIVSYTKSKYSSNSKFVGRRLLRGRVVIAEGRRILISTKPFVNV
jgi:hypothetical protein